MKNGFFYSFNVEVSGLRGFLRRSARLPGWGAGLAMTYALATTPNTNQQTVAINSPM